MARSEPGPSSAAPRPQRGKARIVLTVPLLLVKAPNPSLGSFRAPRLQEAPVRSLMYPFPQPTCRHVFTKHLLCARQYDSKGRLVGEAHTCCVLGCAQGQAGPRAPGQEGDQGGLPGGGEGLRPKSWVAIQKQDFILVQLFNKHLLWSGQWARSWRQRDAFRFTIQQGGRRVMRSAVGCGRGCGTPGSMGWGQEADGGTHGQHGEGMGWQVMSRV